MSLITLRNANKFYPIGKEKFHALKSVSLQIEKGEFVSIEGKSGAGKSTLLNILGGIDCMDSGEYFLNDVPVHALSESKLAKLRNREIGYVFQDFCLINHQTVLFNTMLPLFFDKIKYNDMKRKALDALEQVGIANQANKTANQLSGGQRQRVAIARAMIHKPSLILADEPTGALDSDTSIQIMDLLRNLNQEGTTIVVVTHDSFVSSCCNRKFLLQDGSLT